MIDFTDAHIYAETLHPEAAVAESAAVTEEETNDVGTTTPISGKMPTTAVELLSFIKSQCDANPDAELIACFSTEDDAAAVMNLMSGEIIDDTFRYTFNTSIGNQMQGAVPVKYLAAATAQEIRQAKKNPADLKLRFAVGSDQYEIKSAVIADGMPIDNQKFKILGFQLKHSSEQMKTSGAAVTVNRPKTTTDLVNAFDELKRKSGRSLDQMPVRCELPDGRSLMLTNWVFPLGKEKSFARVVMFKPENDETPATVKSIKNALSRHGNRELVIAEPSKQGGFEIDTVKIDPGDMPTLVLGEWGELAESKPSLKELREAICYWQNVLKQL